MRRLLATIGAAAMRAAAGHVLYQVRRRQVATTEASPIIAGAPLASIVIAATAGRLTGSCSPCVACLAGFAVSVATGSELDRMIPGLGGLYERVSGTPS